MELSSKKLGKGKIVLGVIGAGNYATGNLLPHLESHPDVFFGSICTGTGMKAMNVLEKFGFQAAESDVSRIISESDAVLVATRHNLHTDIALKVLEAQNPVFVEKHTSDSEMIIPVEAGIQKN